MKRSSTTREIGPTARLVESRKTSLAVDSVPVRTTSSRNTGSPVLSCALAPDNSRETSLCAAAVAPISCCAWAEVAKPISAPIMRQKQEKQLVRCIFRPPGNRRYDLQNFAITQRILATPTLNRNAPANRNKVSYLYHIAFERSTARFNSLAGGDWLAKEDDDARGIEPAKGVIDAICRSAGGEPSKPLSLLQNSVSAVNLRSP